MTTKKDNLENRLKQLGEGQEESIGVPEDGFQDPTGAVSYTHLTLPTTVFV